MKQVLLSPRRGLWLIRPALQVAFLQWPALCRVLSMVEPWQAHGASLETLSALAGISRTNQTYTVHWLKNVMLTINWEALCVFGEFFCRKAARYKKCIKHWHWYSCLNNNPMNELYKSCYSFVYPSKELFITFPPPRPTWMGKRGGAQEEFWMEPGKCNVPQRLTVIHSSIFLSIHVPGSYMDTWDVFVVPDFGECTVEV